MNIREFEEIHTLWTGRAWPTNWVVQVWKFVSERVSFDTKFLDWDVVIFGGDPLSRFAALRGCRRFDRVVLTSPVHPAQCGVPWIYEMVTRERIAEIMGCDVDEIGEVMREGIMHHRVILEETGWIYRTDRILKVTSSGECYVLFGRDGRVLTPGERLEGLMEAWERMDGLFAPVKRLDTRAALVGGRLGRLVNLSASEVVERRGREGDFSFPISPLQPMSQARTLWLERFERLWSNAGKG